MLFSRWPIRNKLQLGLGLLAASVLTLFGSAYYGLYAYRGLVKSLSARSAELPLADQLRDCLAELHEILSQVEDQQRFDEIASGALATNNAADQTVWDADGILRQKCRNQFDLFCQTLEQYRDQLDTNRLRTDSGHRRRHVRARYAGQNRRCSGPHPQARYRTIHRAGGSITSTKSASFARMSKRSASGPPNCPVICSSASANWRPMSATNTAGRSALPGALPSSRRSC